MPGVSEPLRRPATNARQAAQARKRRAARLPFETLVERRIREAQEKGDFDDLPGRGRPLDLGEENPFEDPDWQLSYHILRNAGMAPRWIELGQELESDWTVCMARMDGYERAVRARVADLRRRLVVPERDLAELSATHQQVVSEITERVRAYNAKVQSFNLSAPVTSVHRQRERVESLLERLAAIEPRRLHALG